MVLKAFCNDSWMNKHRCLCIDGWMISIGRLAGGLSDALTRVSGHASCSVSFLFIFIGLVHGVDLGGSLTGTMAWY